METFQENLEHQKRGKGNRQIVSRRATGLPGHQSGGALAAATTKSSGATGPAMGRAIQVPPRDLGHQLRVVERTKDGELVLVRRRTKDGELVEHVVVRRDATERVRGRQREREEEGEGANHCW